jgi:hypothetical protein
LRLFVRFLLGGLEDTPGTTTVKPRLAERPGTWVMRSGNFRF